MSGFLPMQMDELRALGAEQADFICVSGDAYVDHPSFGPAIISRVVEAEGYLVGMIAQPDWRSDRDFTALGRPRYAFLVTSGNVDSMVAHYTVAKRRRSDDAYSPGGKAGKRPDRALSVYCRKLRALYPDVPIIIGGLEGSLRRFAHYDYWDDAVHPSILAECGADLLVYGMGERQIVEIARRLAAGEAVRALTDIRGTCYLCSPQDTPLGAVQCPDSAVVASDKRAYAKACRRQMDEQDEVRGRTLIQRQNLPSGDRMLVQNPPMPALSQEAFDRVYALPYMRLPHPRYEAEGGIPGFGEVEFSITHNRGCFGGCNFCAITLHQGRRVAVRSGESVLSEAKQFTANPRFKGVISDVGGPTANFRHPSCEKQRSAGLCKDKKCLAPKPCAALRADHREYRELLRRLRGLRGVKKVFVRSGIRYDYLLQDPACDGFLDELCAHHVSGQLRVAPEHVVPAVLDVMGKPPVEVYDRFSEKFYAAAGRLGKEEYLVPYLMSSHPGCTLKDAVALAVYLKNHHLRPDQVQDFYPTPGTVSTCMYYTGLDPYTMKPVYVPRAPEEKAMQRALMQYYLPNHYELVRKALRRAGRADLIGSGPHCLVPESRLPENDAGPSKNRSVGGRPRLPQGRAERSAKPRRKGRR